MSEPDERHQRPHDQHDQPDQPDGHEAATGHVRRRAGWFPEQDGLEAWLEGHRSRAREADGPLHLAVAALRDTVEADPVLRMQVERMVAQVPRGRAYRERHLDSAQEMYALLSAVMETAPEFSGDSMVMLPVAGVLDWVSATPSGFAAFRSPALNAALGRVLDAWAAFLDSPASRYVLNGSDSGWRGGPARAAIGIEQFEHDPDDEHWGYASWNDFFTRRLAPGARPLAAPDDDAVVTSACQSTPYALRQGVAATDAFWLKDQPYSLHDLLAGAPEVDRFVGGTVYQAFLSATDYHRWHAPVAGTVVSARVVPGTYFSEADSEGEDAAQPQDSQGYLAHVAARAVLVLRADHAPLGLVAFVAVGMADVSSCRFAPEVVPGAHVAKGDDIGHFAYGGSTHCLVFGPGALASFELRALPRPGDPAAPEVDVRSHLATARR